MTLKEFLLESPTDVAILQIQKNGEVECTSYSINEYDLITTQMLNSEVMEFVKEEDCTEVWIR